MSWFTSLFSSGSSARKSRNAMSSTHEAFSLPTSSPGFHPHPDAFNPDSLNTPTSAASTYSYPPQSSSGIYDAVPHSNASSHRESGILPLHNAPLPPLPVPPYPLLSETWNRLRTWLAREYPELGDTLNYGILPQDLAQIEMAFGFALPSTVRESYLCVDGQEAESAAGCSEGLFFGLTLLPLEDVLEEWRFWREVDEDPATGASPQLQELMSSIPQGWVRKQYSSRGWIPLVADKAGNYLGVDMHPGEEGEVGQVIVFGRDFDTKVVMWKGDGAGGWAKWLANFVDELESGEGYELGSGNDSSEGSEDSVGYESYFFDGVGGGAGDGGGDSTGGLKLSGEYRGWNVLEAWADRSVRRWQDAGLVPADEPIKPADKAKPSKLPFNEIQLAAAGSGSAEVPIPVLSEMDEETSALATPFGNVTNQKRQPTRQSLPTISVTKPPAPLPVDLPTPDLIEHIPPTPSTSDLEAGGPGDIMMSEVDLESDHGSIVTTRPDVSRSSTAATITPTSLSSRTLTDSPELILPSTSTKTPLEDLLVDSTPIQGAFDHPLSPIHDVPRDHSVKSDEDSPVMVNAEEIRAQSPAETIKLVGGGGVSGAAAAEEAQSDGVLVDSADASDAASVRSVDSASSKSGKQEKRKSISSGLKRISIGGRRKDSVSSIKQIHDN